MENSTDAMSSLREQWGGGSVTITSSTSNGRIGPGAGGGGGGNATGAAAAAAASEWDACTKASEIEELTQMSALLVGLRHLRPPRVGRRAGRCRRLHPARGGRLIDGIIGGIGDIDDAIGGLIGGIGGGGSAASPPPAPCRRCCRRRRRGRRRARGATRSAASRPRRSPASGSNAETGLVAAAADAPVRVLRGGGANEADGCVPVQRLLVTYCCEYACDGCGLIGGGERRRAEAAAAAAGAGARAVRGLQLGGDSCASNVQASALSVRVDIAVGNPTMFAFIGRGADVTIHDAEDGLATRTVPVVPVSLPAQTTTAVAAELSFAPALELDSGDAVSALAAVGVTEGGLEQFLTQLLDELTVGLMVDIEVLRWPLQLPQHLDQDERARGGRRRRRPLRRRRHRARGALRRQRVGVRALPRRQRRRLLKSTAEFSLARCEGGCGQ